MKIYLMILLLYLAGYAPVHFGAGRKLKRVLGLPYLASVALTLLAAFLAPSAMLFYVAIVVIFVATVRSRDDAMCRFVLLMSMMPAIGWPIAFGSLYFGTYSTTLPLSIGMLIAMAIHPARDRGAPTARGFRAEDGLALAIFVIFTDAETRGEPMLGYLRVMTVNVVAFLLPYYLVRRNVRTPEQLQQLLCCFAVAAMSIAMIGLYEARAGWALFDPVNHRFGGFGSAATVFRRGAYLRASGPFGLPLIYAFFFVVATIAICCSRAMFAKPLVWRGCICLLVLGLIAAQSRGALVSAIPAFLVLLVTRRRYAAAAAMLAASGLGGVALFALSGRSAAVSSFLGNTQDIGGGYHDYRQLLLHRGLQEGAKHPIIGQSLKKVLASLADITQGEQIVDLVNTYLNIYLTSGLVGLGVFVTLCAWMMRKLVARARRDANVDAVRSARAFLLSSLTATLIFIATISFAERLPVIMLILAASARMTSSALIRKRPRAQRADSSDPVPDPEPAFVAA